MSPKSKRHKASSSTPNPPIPSNLLTANPTKRILKTICVFGGSNFGRDLAYSRAASDLGKHMAERKIDLIYEGGSQGIRAYTASSAFVGGSQVLGMILKPLAESKIYGKTLGTEVEVPNLPERNGRMLNIADAFIALPGGLGTLEEISNIISWTRLNFHNKPIGLLNTNGFYDSLLYFLNHAAGQGFITQPIHSIIISSSNVVELLDLLQSFVPEVDPLMKQIKWYDEKSITGYKPETVPANEPKNKPEDEPENEAESKPVDEPGTELDIELHL